MQLSCVHPIVSSPWYSMATFVVALMHATVATRGNNLFHFIKKCMNILYVQYSETTPFDILPSECFPGRLSVLSCAWSLVSSGSLSLPSYSAMVKADRGDPAHKKQGLSTTDGGGWRHEDLVEMRHGERVVVVVALDCCRDFFRGLSSSSW